MLSDDELREIEERAEAFAREERGDMHCDLELENEKLQTENRALRAENERLRDLRDACQWALDEMERMRAEVEAEERSTIQVIDERDRLIDDIDRLASEIGLDEADSYWTCSNWVPTNIQYAIADLRRERDTFRAENERLREDLQFVHDLYQDAAIKCDRAQESSRAHQDARRVAEVENERLRQAIDAALRWIHHEDDRQQQPTHIRNALYHLYQVSARPPWMDPEAYSQVFIPSLSLFRMPPSRRVEDHGKRP